MGTSDFFSLTPAADSPRDGSVVAAKSFSEVLFFTLLPTRTLCCRASLGFFLFMLFPASSYLRTVGC